MSEFDPPKPDDPSPLRARLLVNKNERADYRLTCYGDSMEAAVARLYGELCRVDAEWRVRK